MKRFRLFVLLGGCFLLFFLFSFSSVAAQADFSVWVDPFPDENTRVTWWYSFPEDRYYLFLPAGSNTAALRIGCSCEDLQIDGTRAANGTLTSLLTPGSHTLMGNGGSYPLTVLVSESLPAIFIQTESGSLDGILADKSHKERAVVSVAENGAVSLSGAPLQYVKGRGNSTWESGNGKKPFNLKYEKKTDLFGMGAAKKWCLLANAFDPTLLRNTAALTLARLLGVDYAVDSKAADLYMDGIYMGSYLLCESVGVGENRVAIRDLEKENESCSPDVSLQELPSGGSGEEAAPGSRKWTELPLEPADGSGGFLLEFEFPDRYEQEPCGFVSEAGQCVVIKSPEYASRAQVNAIADLYQEMENAVLSPDGRNEQGRSFTEYLDQDSFAKLYLVLELSMNFDGCSSSFFLSKDAGSALFRAGPAWDYDLSFRNYRNAAFDRALQPTLWLVRGNPLITENSGSLENLMVALCRQPLFWATVEKIWQEHLAFIKTLPGLISAAADKTARSALLNGVRWNLLNDGDPVASGQIYLDRCAALCSVIEQRIEALKTGVPAPESLKTVAEIDLNAHAIPTETPSVALPVSEAAESKTTQAPTKGSEPDRAGYEQYLAAVGILFAVGCAVPILIRKRKKGALGVTGNEGEKTE